MTAGKTVRLGVLGCGNVGSALVQLVEAQADAIAARTGVRLEVTKVAVRNLARERLVPVPEGVLTRDAEGVVTDTAVALVIDLTGDIEPARGLVIKPLDQGKHGVTANKELLANCGTDGYASAAAAGRDLLFEA